MVFDIFMDHKKAGKAEVIVAGLYYSITCVCPLPAGNIYKIIASGSSGQINLGTCLRESGKFTIRTKVPIKHLGRENLSFKLLNATPKFIAIESGKQFNFIEKLPEMKLSFESGKPGVWITEV